MREGRCMEEGEGGEEGRKALSIELCREGRGGE